MRRSKSRRSTAARIIWWALVTLAYAAVLVWAGGITGGEQVVGGDAARAVAGVAAAVPDEATALGAIPTPAEAPVVTLGLAAAMVAVAFAWYVVHTYRARHPRARSARLIIRHITTLM